MTSQRSAELGQFLRSRRDRILPHDVGLPGGGQRRVPGLRREEVAVLASVGNTWYTWLEQGRDISPSVEVLESIARALRLSASERVHLLHLAGHSPSPGSGPNCQRANERATKIMQALAPLPAVLVTSWFQPISYNPPYRFMVDDLETIPEERRNLAILHLTDPRWIRGHADHELECAHVVAKLRAAYGRSLENAHWEPLLAMLRRESELFTRLWDTVNVAPDPNLIKTLENVHVGRINVGSTQLTFPETGADTISLFTYTPADQISTTRLNRLSEMIADGRVDHAEGSSQSQPPGPASQSDRASQPGVGRLRLV